MFPQIYTTCIGLICMNLASMYNQAQLIKPIYIKTNRLVRTPNFGNKNLNSMIMCSTIKTASILRPLQFGPDGCLKKPCNFHCSSIKQLILYIVHRWLHAKGFYLLLYLTTLRTWSLSPLDMYIQDISTSYRQMLSGAFEMRRHKSREHCTFDQWTILL